MEAVHKAACRVVETMGGNRSIPTGCYSFSLPHSPVSIYHFCPFTTSIHLPFLTNNKLIVSRWQLVGLNHTERLNSASQGLDLGWL